MPKVNSPARQWFSKVGTFLNEFTRSNTLAWYRQAKDEKYVAVLMDRDCFFSITLEPIVE